MEHDRKLQQLQQVDQVKETSTIEKNHDAEGRTTLNQYTFVKKLGEGTYGKVKLAVGASESEKYAVKIIRKDVLKRRREMVRDEKGRVKYKDAFENVLREIAVMKKLFNKNLIRLYEVIDNAESNKLYLVMELADKGQMIEWDDDNRVFYNLHQKEDYSEERLKEIFAEMIYGLDYLHKNGIVHRDIKPQNILQSGDGTVKIADFGVADIVGDHDLLKKTEGTYHFMAPECVTKDPNPNGYSGKAADIWALGVTFFAFIYYRAPFDAEDSLDLFEKIWSQELEFPDDRRISSDLKDLLTRILQKDPANRITIEDLQNHQWFQKSSIGKELVRKCTLSKTVVVTQEEIKRAITPIGNVVLLKLMASKMVKNFRRVSLTQDNKHDFSKDKRLQAM